MQGLLLNGFPSSKLSARFFLFNSPLCFNHTPTFLGVTFYRTFFLSERVSLLMAKFFSRLKTLQFICASFGAPLRNLFHFFTKLFFSLFSLMLCADGFLSFANVTKQERYHQAARRAITGCLLSFPTPLLFSEAFSSLF